jgi:membrane protein DedA with SNARE-associated domain
VLLQLDPTTIWSLVLTVLGYQAFTQRSTLHTAIVVLAPWFVIVLIGVLATL